MITCAQHPQFEFDILVDLYADGSTSMPLKITKVECRPWGDEYIAKIDGYVTVDVPIDVCSARLVDKDEHLAEVVREAHKRNITSVKTRCVFSVMLDGRAYKAVKNYDQMKMSRYFDVEMVGYNKLDILTNVSVYALESTLTNGQFLSKFKLDLNDSNFMQVGYITNDGIEHVEPTVLNARLEYIINRYALSVYSDIIPMSRFEQSDYYIRKIRLVKE